MRRKPLAISMLVLGQVYTGAVSQAQNHSSDTARDEATLKERMPQLLAQSHVPSVSFAEIVHGRVTMAEAFGEQSKGVPATPTTEYNIASLTKPVTAEVILRLASEGRVSLDEPMYRYWTDPDIAEDERRKLLTPRIALSHQTGFANWRRETNGKLTFLRTPGQSYGYSGEGYQYVARFAEKKTGEPFEKLADELVFKPAAMTFTSYTKKPWMEGRIAIPMDESGAWLEPEIAERYVAADQIYTTPRQYAQFLIRVMMGRGESSTVREQRARIQVDRKPEACSGKKAATCPEAMGFGLGWEVIETKGKKFLMHTGRDPGLFTLVFFDAGAQTGTVVFTNGENGPQVILPLFEMLHVDPDFIAFLKNQA